MSILLVTELVFNALGVCVYNCARVTTEDGSVDAVTPNIGLLLRFIFCILNVNNDILLTMSLMFSF